jgi:hypothetical protein
MAAETLTITQPTVKAISKTIITTPSVIGQPSERRATMERMKAEG